jgi:hypothetical protein
MSTSKGQGRVKDPKTDKRFHLNRPGPTGQGAVKRPAEDRRLCANREDANGIGRVRDPSKDKRIHCDGKERKTGFSLVREGEAS